MAKKPTSPPSSFSFDRREIVRTTHTINTNNRNKSGGSISSLQSMGVTKPERHRGGGERRKWPLAVLAGLALVTAGYVVVKPRLGETSTPTGGSSTTAVSPSSTNAETAQTISTLDFPDTAGTQTAATDAGTPETTPPSASQPVAIGTKIEGTPLVCKAVVDVHKEGADHTAGFEGEFAIVAMARATGQPMNQFVSEQANGVFYQSMRDLNPGMDPAAVENIAVEIDFKSYSACEGFTLLPE